VLIGPEGWTNTNVEVGFPVGTMRWYISAWETSEENPLPQSVVTNGWNGILIDLENKLGASKTSEERERELRLICDAIPLQLWSFDAEGGTPFQNRPVMSYSGLSELQQDSIGWRRIIHPDDLQATEARWQHSLETGEPYRHVHRLRRADGVYRWHKANADAQRGSNGEIMQWFGGSFDIDDVKRSEEELRKSEAELRTILDTIPGMVWSAGPTGEVEYLGKR
jgi:PAS domain S-box-containing protein